MLFQKRSVRKGKCEVCGKEATTISSVLRVCGDCIRNRSEQALPLIEAAHTHVRNAQNFPIQPPSSSTGVRCKICANECQMSHGEQSYCGLRWENQKHLESFTSSQMALVHTYYDGLPTNCCAAWFCPGCTGRGYEDGWALKPSAESGYANLAVFFYGCDFNCLFCQNPSHKEVEGAPSMSLNQFVEKALNPRVSCICYFGGDPGPQLPFALNASTQILEQCGSHRLIRICWETNGIGNPKLMREAAQLSLSSGGIIKIDLKAANPHLARALSGVPNRRAFENFAMIAEEFYGQRPSVPLLTAVTLLTPGYTDEIEVEKIAKFVAELNPDIPYSLLVFHPSYYMKDLPITPPDQVKRCYIAAKKHLNHVNIGNKHLIPENLRNLDKPVF
jgi:pyruvate formate lyase activating enzyme